MSKKTISLRLGLNTRQFERGIKKAQRKMRNFGKSMNQIGGNITRNITMPFAAVGAAGIKMSLDLTKSFTKIETLVGVSADQVAKMRSEVMQLSGATAKPAQELADALFTITSAGLRGADAMNVLDMAAKASAVGLGETDAIARAVTGVIASYGAENMNAADATDTLMAIVREGNLEAESLAPVLGRVTGIAAQLGISFDEVGASIATFTRLGVSSEEAVTGLRGIMNALLKPTKESRDALASVGMTFEELRAKVQDQGLATTLIDLTKSFDGNEEALAALVPNVRGLSAVLGTAGSQGEDYVKIQKNIANSTGIVEKGFKRVSKDAGFKFNQALENLKAVGMDIGSRLLPVLVKLAGFVTNAVGAFNKLSPQVKAVSVGIVAIVAASGPLISIFGAIIMKLSALISPIGLVVAALVAGAVLVVKNWKTVRKAIVDVINYFITLYNESIIFRGIVETVAFAFKQLWANVKFFAKAGWAILKAMGGNIRNLFGGLGDIIMGVFTFDKSKIEEGFESVKEGLKNSLNPDDNPDLKSAIEEHAKTTADNFNTAFDNTLRGKVELITEDDVQNAVDKAGDVANQIKNKIVGAFSGGGSGAAPSGDKPTTTGTMGPMPMDPSWLEGFSSEEEKFWGKSKEGWATWATDAQENINQFESTWGNAMQNVLGILNDFHQAKSDRLAMEQEERIAENDAWLENEMLRIENMRVSEEEKAALKTEAEQKAADKSIAINEAYDKEQRKLARKQAKNDKIAAALDVAVNTASGIAKAVAASPLTGGLPWSAAIAAMGVAQLGAIAAAPLPKLAKGGLAFGETAAIVGDNRNASMDPEVIAPLSKLKEHLGSGVVEVHGVLRGEDILLSSKRTTNRLNRIS